MQRKTEIGVFLIGVGMLISTMALLAGCPTDQPPRAQEGFDQADVENEFTGSDDAEVTAENEGRGAEPEFSPLRSITKDLKIEGRPIKLKIQPLIAVSGSDGTVSVDLNALIDATDLQSQLPALMNKSWSYDECGVRTSTHGASVRPTGTGQLQVGVTAQGQLWECVKTKIPETYWKVRDLGWLGKTKLPAIRWKMKTMKTRLVSQSIVIEALARPVFKGDTVTADIEVTRVVPSGLLGEAVEMLDDLLDLQDKITKLVQREIDQLLRGERLRLPTLFRDFRVSINSLKFIDLGDGQLGIELSATGSITQVQLATLLNEKIENNF